MHQAVLVLAWTVIVAAETVSSQRPAVAAFEVASVRLAAGPGLTSQRMTDTRVDLSFISMRAVLLMAFRVTGYQLDAPDWLAETRVTIQATMPPGATRQQVPEMLQRLLADRFGLVVRREPRAMEVHELSVGSGGHKMREVEPANELDRKFPVSEAAAIAKQRGIAIPQLDTVQDTPDGPVRTVRGDDLGVTTLTSRSTYKLTLNMDRAGRRTQTLDATRMTMAELATVLSTSIGQPVLDKTDLRGSYEFGSVELPIDAAVLEMARRSILSRGGSLEVPNVSVARELDSLGLRLERRRAPIDVIVVDKIERTPTDN
jgi:uncharacterized protein (TIGR03435 family)